MAVVVLFSFFFERWNFCKRVKYILGRKNRQKCTQKNGHWFFFLNWVEKKLRSSVKTECIRDRTNIETKILPSNTCIFISQLWIRNLGLGKFKCENALKNDESTQNVIACTWPISFQQQAKWFWCLPFIFHWIFYVAVLMHYNIECVIVIGIVVSIALCIALQPIFIMI